MAWELTSAVRAMLTVSVAPGGDKGWQKFLEGANQELLLILEAFSRKIESTNRGRNNVLPTSASQNEKLRNFVLAKRKLVVLLFKYSS